MNKIRSIDAVMNKIRSIDAPWQEDLCVGFQHGKNYTTPFIVIGRKGHLLLVEFVDGKRDLYCRDGFESVVKKQIGLDWEELNEA